MINIRTALEQALQKLDQLAPDSRLEAELLLGHLLNKNRAYLFAHPEELLSPTQLNQYQQLIEQRAQGIPIAYLTGTREFWSLSLKVNEHTLIPRHETERLVELALELLPNKPDIRVLDLGTGSGAIALALAKERPFWDITACDYSIEALDMARKNAQDLGISNVSFYHSDWFNNLPDVSYHAIVSNPPYIAEHDPHLKQGDLRFEPLSALASGQDGLADLQCIINRSYNYLLPNGLLLLEHGYDQKNGVRAILDKIGYRDIHCWQDIQGHDRVSGGYRP
ncbi:peptide chain release factor N(5)-glutamine methyltransferase [Legionella maioricensis]|uniref:Release factor glutamine methyltransferase n=1 Tax=Legionella maioricensis TaxID=2896528 RepID=A0A9X2D2R2_9GAMM|nr:peptide chain release factor N(5)-glutamine methyltransferase [Legionella maioricensis]MCL9685494.1 peptide chain release factor N(5)-glutamine methyltransferase [Legionella maioricensis]MCL9688798.1 peptide chain release factor N(5)-glutamine methyltransferase [Legionella maioricensis]